MRRYPDLGRPQPLPPVTYTRRMSPPSDDTPQTPDSNRYPSGFAGVLKHLAAGRLKTSGGSSPAAAAAVTPTSSLLSKALAESRDGNGIETGQIYQVQGGPPDYEQLLQSLQPGQPLSARQTAVGSLRYVIEGYSLSSVMGIWSAAKDLIQSPNPTEARKAGFDLLTTCVKHTDLTALERRHFFDSISEACNREDFHLQLNALVELTNHGKNIEAVEILLLPLLTSWLKVWFEYSNVARAIAKKDKSSKSNDALDEETNLGQLFAFIIESLRFNFKAFWEQHVISLLDQVLCICKKTTAEADIKNSISILDAVITYGDIPESMLAPCVEVLCGVYATLKSLEESTWNAISNLLTSHLARKMVLALLEILRDPSKEHTRNSNTIRGAAAVFKNLLKANGAGGLSLVPFSTLMDALQKSLAIDNSRLDLEVVQVLACLFESEELMALTLEEDWTLLLEILTRSFKRTIDSGNGQPSDSVLNDAQSPSAKISKDKTVTSTLSQILQQILQKLEVSCGILDFTQKEGVMEFFMLNQQHLAHSCVELVINYYADEHLCYPSNEEWLKKSGQLVEIFFKDSSLPAPLRLLVLKTIKDVYQTITGIVSNDIVNNYAISILDAIPVEKDVGVLEALIGFAVEAAIESDEGLFTRIIGYFHERISAKDSGVTTSRTSAQPVITSVSRPTSSGLPPFMSTSTSNVAAKGLVRMFLRSLNLSANRALDVFDELLYLSRSDTCETDARLTAMKLLFRLRSDSNNAILIISTSESEGLASALCRTVESANGNQGTENATQGRSSRSEETSSARSGRSASTGQPQSYMSRSKSTRSVSGPNRSAKPIPPLWMYPGPKALPEDPPTAASSFLCSYVEEPPEGSNDEAPFQSRIALKINVWLEVVITILQNDCDWEVYSYILVHLGSQLTNHSLFKGSVPQIKLLRNVLCEQIKAGSFHEPPSTSGLKKADVAICLFHIITMLLSYRDHFAKSEEDEIVRTFMLGVGSWDRTSKSCIHALSICCHEVPLSISKSLNTILQKMSQIITQTHVAVHILEFLAGLARMPEVYVNFREDDFRTVFGICFRYLQYVRDQREKESAPSSTRTSYASGRQSGTAKDFAPMAETNMPPNASDELPQYVYALAYHVMIFWFLSLRLQDRAKHVGWITRNLVYTDKAGKEVIEEQSQVTVDMMQRVAYSDRDETMLPPPLSSSVSDEIVMKKSWMMGLSIVTVETAVMSGLSQVTKRQPSGTIHSIFKQDFAKPAPHQIPLSTEKVSDTSNASSRAAVLPSHIFLQFIGSSAGIPAALQPIPLPDDDATNRAISTFDRNSTVDGHSIGVIYVGEDQESESEILANVMGSADYTDFLSGLGTLIRLKGAKFNTQGLDREYNTDGEFTFCWRDRVTEIVFHITTMMPTNLDHDPLCTNKKKHTGNDFVNIIFNNSGLPFNFDTFPSQLNFVNIVITPESRASFVATRLRSYDEREKEFYKVQVMSKPGFPEISPAAETKIVSGKSLPSFVRLLALNASVFSLVWATREGGEHVSSWRNRLREIVRLRYKRISSSSSAASPSPASPPYVTQQLHSSQAGSRDSSTARRASANTFLSEGTSHRSSVLSNNTEVDVAASQDNGSMVDNFDFSRWA
ncbi:MAG: Tuberous sclerosis 2-like protein [Pycnora praestabilis]|nr:MAG: Tuberous sclerosis 2-like protein [Pycnora praestabilis]